MDGETYKEWKKESMKRCDETLYGGQKGNEQSGGNTLTQSEFTQSLKIKHPGTVMNTTYLLICMLYIMHWKL